MRRTWGLIGGGFIALCLLLAGCMHEGGKGTSGPPLTSLPPELTVHLEQQANGYYLITVDGHPELIIVCSTMPTLPKFDSNVGKIHPPQNENYIGSTPDVRIESGWIYLQGFGIRIGGHYGSSTVAAMTDSSKLIVDLTPLYPRVVHPPHTNQGSANGWIEGTTTQYFIDVGRSRALQAFNGFEPYPGDPISGGDAVLAQIGDVCDQIKQSHSGIQLERPQAPPASTHP